MVECQQAFEDLKAYLSSPPLLSPSKPREELFLYLAVSLAAVSATLVREEERVQKPVYYTSQALRGAEERYPPMEKLAFALITTARKFKPYFQAHTMVVLTDRPLRRAMSNPKATGKMALWAIKLSEFDIQYRPRIAQASGAGIVIHYPEGDEIECMVHLDFPTTNNKAEYEALVAGLDLTKATWATSVIVYCDFQVIMSQVNGDYECKGERMKNYLEQVRKQVENDLQAKFVQIPREENEQADRLTKAASAKHTLISSKVLSFVQLSPMINGMVVQEISSERN
ncbi:uncharacterized protein LOC142621555 [Castanea sativa]|uniref:uncharacterized protein LOC142621555 n=1 Tax=Castanea sativa TaxID=21020 RepID=UPI003F64DAB2